MATTSERSSRRQARDPEADDGDVPSLLGSHRGRLSVPPPDRVEADRIGDAFQRHRADVGDGEAFLVDRPDDVVAHEDLPCERLPRDPGGKVDRATEVVTA